MTDQTNSLRADLADGGSYDFSICSDDLPPPFAAPWFTRSRWEMMVDSAKFAIADNPDGLRMAGSAAVATAMVQAAEANLTDGRQDVREYSKLVIEYFADKHFLHETFDYFVGLRRRDNKISISRVDRLTERDDLLRQIAGLRVYAGLTPRQAARSIQDDFALYLPKHDATRTGRPQGERDGLFWVLEGMRKSKNRPGLNKIMPEDEGHLSRIIDR